MRESKKLRPIGCIDFLGTNGKVGESCYYYSEEDFLKTIKEENYHGVPMVVNVYRNEQGQTISIDFAKDFDPLPQGFEILDYKESEDMRMTSEGSSSLQSSIKLCSRKAHESFSK